MALMFQAMIRAGVPLMEALVVTTPWTMRMQVRLM